MVGHMLASGNAMKSWRSTRVAQQLGIDYPIIQAPFGGLPSQRLTATVSNLGGLGSLGAVTLGSSAISEVIAEIRSLTSKPFAINLWVSTSDRELQSLSRSRSAGRWPKRNSRRKFRESAFYVLARQLTPMSIHSVRGSVNLATQRGKILLLSTGMQRGNPIACLTLLLRWIV